MSCTPEELPPLWQKPPFEKLVIGLRSLRLQPRVWSLAESRSEISNERETVQSRREITSYLSNIIKSPLDWIEDEDHRDELWTEASKRLSERCGRTAMGEMMRTWPFEGDSSPAFNLVIREPPLTGDKLGLKTWGSSYRMAQMLPSLAASHLTHLLSAQQDVVPILELGSGTGLLGLAAAVTWRREVILSDLPSIMPNLLSNVELNQATLEAEGGSIRAGALTWGGSEDEIDQNLFRLENQFKIILAADPLYDDNHPELLSGAIHDHLSLDEDARALVMVPQRDETTISLGSKFKTRMTQEHTPLVCLVEGFVPCQDDWGDDDDGSPQVDCWWGIFKRCHSQA